MIEPSLEILAGKSDMEADTANFRRDVESLAAQWQTFGLPSRAGLEAAGKELLALRQAAKSDGLWKNPPLMVTATLDDGLGQGLMIIHQFAEAVGMRLKPLGLMRPPAHIIAACRKENPDFLGLTVLQFDSETDLAVITRDLPRKTRLICGGPIFNADPELARRCGVHFTARDVGAFLEILLTLSNANHSR